MKLIIACVSLVLASQAFAKPMTIPYAFSGSASADALDSDFEGIAKLSGCSASLVKFKGQSIKSKGIMLTNDHCLDDQAYGTYTFNKAYKKSFSIFDKFKKVIPKAFVSTRIIYATQTDSDFGLLEINETYEEIEKDYDVRPLEIADASANVGDSILVITGYFGKVIECKVDGFVHKLVESSWTWTNSYRYDYCDTGHGTSGSPIVLKGTREVVGINNTGNDDGQKCTLNNPCEVTATGVITADKGRSYGQQISNVYTCLNRQGAFDLKTPGCKLLGGDSRQ